MKKSNCFCMTVVLILSLIAASGCAKNPSLTKPVNLAATSDSAKDVTVIYPVKKHGHKGGDVTPSQAYKMAMEDQHVFIVDVRTRPEYVLVGHPTIAYHVPVKFWTGKHTSKGYGMIPNENFAQDLKNRFNPETDTLIFMCRSGGRSCEAANEAAAKANWPVDQTYNMMGGFEGDKVKNKDSVFDGKRVLGGWKNEGLPWTYSVDPKRGYPEAN
ncbi:rhodanese-like domain-containing protein [uncultured Desulfobacter sp.]|uniref:rhodanese-like domain-containing protein n=1 Tax=uncultured Desulfobacter sp. TaxID=240139 RepID=UPI002AAB9B56|nr:rhodanese-like domain-containing protein [uncultured Desulfobacter sp.]